MTSTAEPIDETASAAVPEAEEDATPPPGWLKDDRISFSRETRKYLQENDDGSEMEWHPKLKAWMPVVRLPPPPVPCNPLYTMQFLTE
jgi:hypothetical protein